MQITQRPDSHDGEQRKLGAVMFADMTGYTAMMQEDEAKARELRKRQRYVLETLIPAHQGTIIQYFGDGTLALFDSAAKAVRCGIVIQNELQKEPKVRLRIGIHAGDVVYDKEGIYGDCVNLASRIESISIPGACFFQPGFMMKLRTSWILKQDRLENFILKTLNIPLKFTQP